MPEEQTLAETCEIPGNIASIYAKLKKRYTPEEASIKIKEQLQIFGILLILFNSENRNKDFNQNLPVELTN